MIWLSYLMMFAGFVMLYFYLRQTREPHRALQTTVGWAAIYCMALGLYILAG